MDYGKVLGRAWHITWRWKVLWVLGFLAALGSGGGGSPGNATYNQDLQDYGYGPWNSFADFQEFLAPFLGIIILICCVLFIISIALWVVSVIARGGLIAGVQQVEDEGSTTFRSAWVAGRRKFWTLFGLSILAALPMMVVVFLLVLLVAAGIAAGIGMMEVEEWLGISAIVITSIAGLALLCCGLFIIGIVLEQIRVYGERAAIIEDLGWIDAFKRGWQVLKTNLGPTVIFWILFAALGIVIFIVMMVLMLAIFVPVVIAFGLGSQIIEPQMWMILPAVCFGLVAVVVSALVRSIITAYISTTWTLAYREMTGVGQEQLEPASTA